MLSWEIKDDRPIGVYMITTLYCLSNKCVLIFHSFLFTVYAE